MSSTIGSNPAATGVGSTGARPTTRPTEKRDHEQEHREGDVARTIEQQTAKVPSDWFLWAAVGSMATSLAFQLGHRQNTANFIGQWAPTLLILGLYNKVVKLAGSDADDLKRRVRQG